MKKQFFTSVCFVVCATSFSFWKMEGPYVIDIEPNESSINQSYSINKESLTWVHRRRGLCRDIPFLYDPHTSTCITLVGPHNHTQHYNYNILKNNFSYDDQFWKTTEENNQVNDNEVYSHFVYFKYNLNTQNDGNFSKQKIDNFEESLNTYLTFRSCIIFKHKDDPNKNHTNESDETIFKNCFTQDYNIPGFSRDNILHFELYKNNIIYKGSQKNGDSPLNINIYNREDGVTLTQNNKSVDLQEALKKYFSKTGYSHFANSLGGDNPPKVYEKIAGEPEKPLISLGTIRNLIKAHHPKLEQKSLKLLHECKILALWTLIPEKIENKDKKGNIETRKVHKLFGLAEDKEGRKFNWITELNNEVSVLMQYAK